MADDATLYRARAAAEQAAADASTLGNVRDRCERSAKAWTDMAVRAERVVTQRHEREDAAAARADAAASASTAEA
jgi:hypothetical protein